MISKSMLTSATTKRNAIYFGVGLACAATGVLASRTRRINFAHKVVVITGGSRGLGLAMAEEFGRRGARLVLAARDAEGLLRAMQKLVDTGTVNPDNILTVTADLRQQPDAERLIEQATERFGRVDVLVNNAGIITVGPVECQTIHDFQEVMRSNFFSGLYCTMAVLPQMIERHSGSIANITSIGGKVAVPHLLPYTASKFAAVGFSEGLGAEVRSKGIRVTTVVPGLMRTGSHRNAIFSGDAEREYKWFSFSDNLPGVSTSARSAARQIVNGIACGDVELSITPHAKIASRFGNVMPGVRRGVMQLANWILPAASQGQSSKHRGAEVSKREPLPARTLGRAAARRYNQTGELAS
jgi:NAD(P)-dependent dehydrogenase (short-subunit alcohol dehydrogenase family)